MTYVVFGDQYNIKNDKLVDYEIVLILIHPYHEGHLG